MLTSLSKVLAIGWYNDVVTKALIIYTTSDRDHMTVSMHIFAADILLVNFCTLHAPHVG